MSFNNLIVEKINGITYNPSGGSSSVGPVNNVNTSDGAGGFLETDVTITGGDIVCDTINGSAPTSWIIPWTNWEYFTWYEGNQAWFPAAAQNDPPFPQPPLQTTYGSANIFVPISGTYRFTVVTITNSDSAILHFNCNSVDTYIDAYSSVLDGISYTWTQSLVQGINECTLDTLTKNPSSSDYQIRLRLSGLMVSLS